MATIVIASVGSLISILVLINRFRQKVTSDEGKIYSVGRPNDPFSELDDDFDEGLDDF